ncbi:NAD-dependent dehydratase [candidate division GN15 bacterium]|uniref:NAD-dependent dehydratase n=1 Tax=candidate division GN15 bacterium TaxID=2072418 RepID=A0A855X803_9BACT|nr:MAG: NAD-dependent dehydratase [candidate division GN15 bacterium]
MSGDLHGKRILVTGAGGFLGSALTVRLASLGAEVHGVSRNAHRTDESGMKWWQVDLAHDREVKGLLENVRPEYIFHLAGLPDGRRDLDLVGPTFINNAAMTVHLLSAAIATDCKRFIYASSMEEPPLSVPTAKPHSPYSASKWVGSVYCRMFRELYGLPVVSLRIYLTYGPGPQLETKLIPYVITSLLRGKSPRLSSGSRLIDAIYIDDVTDAFVAALSGEKVPEQVVEIGSGKLISIAEVVQKISRLVGGDIRPALGALPDRPDEVMPSADIENTLRLLAWRPRVSLETGLQRTIEWYRRELALNASPTTGQSDGRDKRR